VFHELCASAPEGLVTTVSSLGTRGAAAAGAAAETASANSAPPADAATTILFRDLFGVIRCHSPFIFPGNLYDTSLN
jgi:hypothetical protein